MEPACLVRGGPAIGLFPKADAGVAAACDACRGTRGFGFCRVARSAGALIPGSRGGFGAKVLCGRRRDGAAGLQNPRSSRPWPRSGGLWATGFTRASKLCPKTAREGWGRGVPATRERRFSHIMPGEGPWCFGVDVLLVQTSGELPGREGKNAILL